MNQQKMMFISLQKISASFLAISALTTSVLTTGFQLSASAISIGVSPPRFELKLDEKRPIAQVFRVVNLGSKPVTFKVKISCNDSLLILRQPDSTFVHSVEA